MCTAITFKTKNSYFGRNLDLDYSYNELVIITPRNYKFKFRMGREIEKHYAMIGMANEVNDYPLYYDAINEKGLGMAGLSFHVGAKYKDEESGKDNIASFEFIPWILAQCSNINEAKRLLKKINIVNWDFSDELPKSPLHWIVADKNEAITVEATEQGVVVYDNQVGVLTNDPGFDMQMFNLNNYLNITNKTADNRFSDKIELKSYCKGMGGIGLPGDLSSMSRFVKASFTKLNSVSGDEEEESISQFFHILESVFQQRGAVKTNDDKYEVTYYSSCCNQDKGIYYYKTYENSQITAIDMNRIDLNGKKITGYPLIKRQKINYIN